MPFDTSRQQPSPFPARPQVAPYQADSVERTFIAAVYRWMTLGLVVTAGVAGFVASSEAALELVVLNRWVFYGLMIAEVGLVIAISAMVQRLSAAAAGGLFLLYSALNGATLSVLLLVYTGGSVAMAFAVTAGTFGAMSVYGTVTKRDLTSWSSFLFMGLIGIVLAGLVNVFLKSDAMSFVLSCASVVVFTGLTAYDTQKLRVFAREGGASVAAAPITGALSLYLDFINLFIAILRLFGDRRR
ncbi:MAG TPA: Bax inhibitor-1/YccA family protein [Anaeromyxobacteraceae bacterium]|nr:Bax inhibitor-1/YccA family protein [Anaeromyxobacteraceae bacterium]